MNSERIQNGNGGLVQGSKGRVSGSVGKLERSIDWKQGLAIATGVPLLILPSIGYFAGHLWAAAIIAWGLSVLQGFMQNFAYGELATAFPDASGIPGYAQSVFKTSDFNGKYDYRKLIGGFSAWGYWFAWNPILAIFSLLVGNYLHGLVPALASVFTAHQLSLLAGVVIFGGLILVNYRGLHSGAVLGYILAALSLAPLLIISGAPFFTGDFTLSNITSSWLPKDWSWDEKHILVVLGVLATAEWSACGWEAAVIYGPEYKKPHSDIPRALFSCGALCLVTYVLVQTVVTGVLGVEGILANTVSPLLPVAQRTFGPLGVGVSIIMLVAAMILAIQTAYLGSARAMHSMAKEGNLPGVFGRLNARGTPVIAMVVIGLFNIAFITLKTPTAILGASAIGYICANGICLFGYVRARREPRLAALERSFKAPEAWKYVAIAFGLLNLPLFLAGVVFLNSLEVGWRSTWIGFGMMVLYVPLWIYSQHERAKVNTSETSQNKEVGRF
jgi:amino acid transporter